MKCYVKWPDSDMYSGPYDLSLDDGATVVVNVNGTDYYSPAIPRTWTVGIDDGWTVWEGGDGCPVPEGRRFEVMWRNGETYVPMRRCEWRHSCEWDDIIAYRILYGGWRDWTPGSGQPKETRGMMGEWESKMGSTFPADFDELLWHDDSTLRRYRIAGKAAKPEPTMAEIMDRSLWWVLPDGEAVAVEYRRAGGALKLSDGRLVDRSWFRGREHKRAEEFEG